jgi:hypothetical protein
LIVPDRLKPMPDSTEETIAEQIMRIHANILNTAILSGIPLDR